MRIELDYNIVSAEERCSAVTALVEKGAFAKATNSQLEKAANYILYGKSPSGKPLPQAKEISTKHSTWKRKQPESLDALMENVLFDEQTVRPFDSRSPYTNPKPTIDHEKDADIPGMQDLWAAIENTKQLYESEKECGKSLRAYYLRHLLIDLRKEQYLLKEMFKPTLHFNSPILTLKYQGINWFSDTGYAHPPLEVNTKNHYIGPDEWEWHSVGEHTIDFTNPIHIYHILENYSSLAQQIHGNPLCSTYLLLRAVECLVDKTPLTPVRKHILIRKIDKISNEQIAHELQMFYNTTYAVNYISTIWKREICGAIANTGKIDFDETIAQKKPEKWKTCIKCHARKLKDNRFFVPKREAFDGFAPICRECQKKEKKHVS